MGVLSARGYRAIDHTADLAFELWAQSEPALLLEGARAVTDVLTGGATLSPELFSTVSIEALDGEDRLVQWLNECIYLAVTDGFIVLDADITLDGETKLEATVKGVIAADAVKTELKSVTYHDLALTEADGGWRARIVIDV